MTAFGPVQYLYALKHVILRECHLKRPRKPTRKRRLQWRRLWGNSWCCGSALCTKLMLTSCDFAAGAAEVHFVYCTDSVLKSCGFPAGAAEVFYATNLVLKSCDPLALAICFIPKNGRFEKKEAKAAPMFFLFAQGPLPQGRQGLY